MNPGSRKKNVVSVFVLLSLLFVLTNGLSYAGKLPASKTTEQEILEQKEAAEDTVQTQEVITPSDVQTAIKNLPEDTTPQYNIREIVLSGNTLFTTEQLIGDLPEVYNASPSGELESTKLYDLRPLQSLIALPGTPQKVSARSILGLTQYIVSVYTIQNDYAGIYVYPPTEAFETGGELEQGILPIRILEAVVAEVSSNYFDIGNQPAEKTYLSIDALESWSPVQPDKVANRKELDDFLNLLNKNPDRYVSAVVSQGPEENTLALNYNVYEADPWHYFAQVDNSGTKNVQWKPRFGLINTNLLGFDDKLTAIYQVPLESNWDEEYSIYGSYDFPIWGPKLRLNLYAGYNEFAINDTGEAVNFLGRGDFYGGRLRYNAFQKDGWFFDVLGGLSYQTSKITQDFSGTSLGLSTDIWMFTWDYGFELSKTDDMTDTTLSFRQERSIDATDKGKMSGFGGRSGTGPHFVFNTLNARHSRYLDNSKIQRFSGRLQWIDPDDRLPAAKMTSYGGMYTVRGYDEYEITADGGLLASIQYEYDLIRKGQLELFGEQASDEEARKPFLKKLAPLGFMDYGLAKIEDPTSTEHYDQELCSVGGGVITELGDNFTGTVYYGYPLINTTKTHTGKGHLNVGFLLRW